MRGWFGGELTTLGLNCDAVDGYSAGKVSSPEHTARRFKCYTSLLCHFILALFLYDLSFILVRVCPGKDPLYFVCNINDRVNVFRHSFFYRTHNLWNRLPLELRMIVDATQFENELRKHLAESNLQDPEPD